MKEEYKKFVQSVTLTNETNGDTRIVKPTPQDVVFQFASKELLRLCENGDIYVNGRLAENDKEVVDAFREFTFGVTGK